MAKDLADDTSLGEDKTDTSETMSEFGELVRGVEQSTPKADDQEVVEEAEPETEEVEEEAEPETPVVEGPTIAAKMAAEAAGIPPALVNLATSDEQLEKFIALTREVAEPEEAEEVATPELKLDLPDDEYPEDDPVRRELTKIQSHFAEQLATVKGQLKEATSKTAQFEQQQKAQSDQQARQMQEEFDRELDSFKAKVFGSTKDLSQPNLHARSAAFGLVQDLKANNPGKSMSELVKMVAAEWDVKTDTKTADDKEAIRKQSKKRLGSGPSQPAEPGVRSDDEIMAAFLESKGLK